MENRFFMLIKFPRYANQDENKTFRTLNDNIIVFFRE